MVGPVFFEVFVPAGVRAVPGEERYVDRIPVGLGGALNPASVAAALGVDVTLVHPAGDGLLDAAVAAAVARLGIASRTWPSRPDPFLSLVFSDATDRGFISHGDYACIGRCPPLPPADALYVGGIREGYALLDRGAEARRTGARVVVTGCWSPDDLARLGRERDRPWDLLVLNRREAAVAAGDADLAPERLSGAASDVVVTDGADGAFGLLGGERVRTEAVPVPVADLTGAGDAFAAGLVVAGLRGLSPRASVALAAAVASRVVGILGGVVTDPAVLAGL